MKKIFGCCGIECSSCTYFKKKCGGCFSDKGKVFWAKYTDIKMCEIYVCCVDKSNLDNCGLCSAMPCKKINVYDPSMSVEQNQKAWETQINNLKIMSDEKR